MCQVDKGNNLKRQIHTMLLNLICDFYDKLSYLKNLPCSTSEIPQRVTGYDFHSILWHTRKVILLLFEYFYAHP